MESSVQTPSAEEQKMAVLAHGSILLTFIVAITTGGIGVLVAVMVPLFIYLVYRDRSRYIAFHALQATMFQLALVVLFLALGGVYAVLLAAIWAITAILSILIVGLILVPVAIILTIIGALILAAVPLGGLAYGLAAAWEVYNYRDFRYHWVADWLEQRVKI